MFKIIETRKYNKDLKKTKLSLAQNTLLNICVQALKNKRKIPASARLKKLTGEWMGYHSLCLGFDMRIIFKLYGEQIELIRIGTHNQLYNRI